MPESRRSRRALIGGAAVLAATIAVGTAVILGSGGGSDASARAARDYLAAWSRGDAAAMSGQLDAPPPDLPARVASLAKSASGTHAAMTLRTMTGSGATRSASYHAHLDVGGFGPLDWDGQLPMHHATNRWLVHWQPDDIYPGLADGQHLSLERTWPTRAPILGADGTPLVSDAPTVAIGVEPDRMSNVATVQAALHSVLNVDPAAVTRALAAPGVKPNFFVPVTTVAADRFTALRPQLAPVPGIVFQRTHGRVPVAPGLGGTVIGTFGPVTAERVAQLGAPYRAGDNAGLSGIEAVYETRLAGRPAQDIDIVGRDGTTARPIAHQAGTDPQPVQLTLDAKTQQAAEAALAGVAQPAALVAIDSATGALRAVVSDPPDQAFDRALDGRYPPGSTFKIVTTAALLATGSTPATPAPCPPQLTVGGLRFKNFEGEAPGSIPLHTAFAISCNTAFVGLASHLPGGALSTAATSFGFGAPVRLPVPAVGGTFPAPSDQAETAAAAIGQAKVTASPMQMASVAATAASGQWRAPTLVLQPPSALGPSVPPLGPAVVAGLRSFMAEVVTAGTGTAAAVPGDRKSVV